MSTTPFTFAANKRTLLLLLLVVSISGLIMVALALRFGIPMAGRAIFYPNPPALPAEVAGDMTALLKQLEAELQIKAPKALADLNPGLSAEAISQIERTSGITLPPDVRALYQWRNGQITGSTNEMLPGHFFVPLDEALKVNQMTQPHGLLDAFLISHQAGWLPVFDDGASDGYFLDTKKGSQPGHFFYHLAEESYYLYFPSLRNFLAGLTACYAEGAIHFDATSNSLEEDYKKSEPIWNKFGKANEL